MTTQTPAAPGPGGPRPPMRVGDAERDLVVERLRSALEEGRLTPEEFEERVGAALSARTAADLAPLTADLPGPDPLSPGAPPVPAPGLLPARAGQQEGCASTARGWWAWGTASGISSLVWAVTTPTEWDYPWPLWVAGPWGVVLAARTLRERGEARRVRPRPLPGRSPGGPGALH